MIFQSVWLNEFFMNKKENPFISKHNITSLIKLHVIPKKNMYFLSKMIFNRKEFTAIFYAYLKFSVKFGMRELHGHE